MQYTQTKNNMEQGRTGENLMQRGNQQQQPPRRRPENQMAVQNHHHHQPPPPQKCPRCDSSNTKFCYYNNYSLSQPRYFCKACRRYWTHGGTLRNVPVGGGCRKVKRPKPQISSSSSTGEIARTEAALHPQNNLTGMNSGQALRAPIMPSMGNNNSFYTGGAFLSSLAAMQSLSAGINQAAATANFGAGAGNSQYDANMALIQNLQSLKPHIHHQAKNEIFPSQQSLNIPARPALNSWTQSFIRGSSGSSAGPSFSFWTRAAGYGENQAGSNSFNPNQWPDNNNSGFDPSG